MDTPIIRVAGALLTIGLAYAIQTKWNPPEVSAPANASYMAEVEKRIATGDYKGALAPAAALYSEHPDNHIYIERLATIDEHLGKYKEATALWEEFLQRSPTPIEACPQIGADYSRQNRSDMAIDALKRCLAFEPNNPDVLYALGNTWEREGDSSHAAEYYRKGLDAAPNDPDLALGAGRLALRAGDVTRAWDAASGVLTRYPENSDALLLAGLTAERRSDLKAARMHLEHGARVSPRYADIQVALAQLDEREQHPRDALSHYRRALELDPGNRTASERMRAIAERN